MARPVVVVVDDEDASRQALARELEGRYGADYRIVSSTSPQEALAELKQLQVEGADVPLVLAARRSRVGPSGPLAGRPGPIGP